MGEVDKWYKYQFSLKPSQCPRLAFQILLRFPLSQNRVVKLGQ